MYFHTTILTLFYKGNNMNISLGINSITKELECSQIVADLKTSSLLTNKKATQVNLPGSSVASNHPSHIPLLDKEIKANMVESVLEYLEESKDANCLDIEEIVFPSSVVSETDAMTKILENLQIQAQAKKKINILENPQVQAQPTEVNILKNLKVQAQPKKINKKKQQKQNRLQRSAQKLQQEQQAKEKIIQQLAQQKEKIIQQGAQQDANKQQGFSLTPLISYPSREIREDGTTLGEDFRSSECITGQIAERHMWKKLNFFLVMCQYIADKAPYLKNYDFPLRCKNQFQAIANIVPASFKQRTDKDIYFECAHISLLNKIVLMKDKNLFKMDGDLTLTTTLKIRTSVHQFFNICDIAPNRINSIDWYIEFYLRENAYKLLDLVKKGHQTFDEATDVFAHECGKCLMELKDRIRYNYPQANKGCYNKKEFAENMKHIMDNKNQSLEYIEGMLIAINHFITYYPTTLSAYKNKPVYFLYEKNS
jgi:hypothetical protein